MTQATELLNSIDETMHPSNSSTEPHIVIGADRFITVPDELKRIAVQFDHNIETVTFDCPRYWDGHDLFDMKMYINYIRPDKKPDAYEIKDLTIDSENENILHFTWTISKFVTAVSGKIAFLVCAKNIDENGEEQNRWNSEPNINDLYVSSGMDTVQDIVDDETELITQLLSSIESVEKNTAALDVSNDDNGKIMQVVDGVATFVTFEDSSVKTYIDEYIGDALGGDY